VFKSRLAGWDTTGGRYRRGFVIADANGIRDFTEIERCRS
jgi:hypothetical protein